MKENLIKSKKRVQKHGEVFTPSWMVQKMLDTPGIKEACENISATFLEPSFASYFRKKIICRYHAI